MDNEPDEYCFDDKYPFEEWPLTFNFTKRLPPGVFLTGIPVVKVSVRKGYDNTPAAMFNGQLGFDSDTTPVQVIQPIQGGIPGTTYVFECDCLTTQANLAVTLVGVLRVIKGA